jgi:uncharacterized protein YkwD
MGAVSAHEQYFLEILNAARANPAREAKRLGMDLNQGLSPGSISTAPKPPLVMHHQLHWAARLHSRDMLARKYFEHTSLDGRDPTARARAQGFRGGVSENLSSVGFANSSDPTPNFAIRSGHDGLFRSPGHRANMMADGQAFIGLGVAIGAGIFSAKDMMATQKFSSASSAGEARPFITGVAYLDLDRNRFYTPGEGIEGAIVTTPGSPVRARTGRAGGFALPVGSNGDHTVHFSVPGLGKVKRVARVQNGRNAKLNFASVYRQPVLQSRGPVPQPRKATGYVISSVAGAQRLDLQFNRLRPAGPEVAEPRQSRVKTNAPQTQPIVQSSAAAQGGFVFRLSNNGSHELQYVELLRTFVPSAKGQIEFQARLVREQHFQIPKVQVLSDGKWRTVWQQKPTILDAQPTWISDTDSTHGGTDFGKIVISLAPFAGKEIRIRFALDPDGVISTGSTSGGWYFDDILLPGVREFGPWKTVRANRNRRASFVPPVAGDYVLRARAQFAGRFLTGPNRFVRVKAR